MKNNVLKIIFLSVLMVSCKENQQKETPLNTPKEQIEEKNKAISYVYNDGGAPIEVQLKNPPKRVATFAPHATEILLALGLGDKMIIASTEEPVPAQYQADYEKIPQKFTGHSFKMNREAFLLEQPDFVFGYPYDMKQEIIGTPQDLIKQGINPFVLSSVAIPNATLENVYQDILQIGKVFAVEDRAEKLVTEMKNKLQSSELIKPKTETEKPKVMVINSFNNGVWIGGALATDLVSRAGGVNVYSDVPGDGEWVSYESMLARNPDVIFITDIASRPVKFDEKLKILKTDPILKDISAVKNNKIYKANLGDVNPGIRNADFIIRMNHIFYKGGK